MTTMIGFSNQFTAGTLGANNASKPVTNLALPTGDSKSSWETDPGVTDARITLDAKSPVTWRAFLLARTNLTPSASVRWVTGTKPGVIPEDPTIFLDFDEDYAAPLTGTVSYVRNTPSWRRKSDGVWEEVAANALALHYNAAGVLLGHQFQRQLTNRVRNPRLEGGVAGAPGTPPTNCTNAVGGTSAQIGAVNVVEDGLPAVDWRVTGTTAGATNCIFFFETTTGLAAVQNDLIYFSLHARLVGGDLSNISSLRMGITEYDAGGLPLGAGSWTTISVNELRLGAQRLETVLTVSSATCAFIRPYFQVRIAAAGPVEATFRLSVPCAVKSATAIHGSFVPITPPSASPATSTRDADNFTYTPAEDIMVNGEMTVYTSLAVLDSLGSVGSQANIQIDNNSTSYIRLRPYTSGGTQWSDSIVSLAGTLIVDTPALSSGIALGSQCRYVMRVAPDTGFNRWVATAGTQAYPDTLSIDLNRIVLNATNGVFNGCIREFRIYNRKLTDGQCSQLANDGTSYDPAGIAYDTGVVNAGVELGYGQSLKVAPDDKIGQYTRCEISDPSNPEGQLRIGLAYAGGVWAPSNGVSWQSAFNPESREQLFLTRGGQEHVEPLFRRRSWQLSFDALVNSEAWSQKLYLEAAAAAGLNVLFIPDDNQDLSFAPVFGRFVTTGGLGYPGKEYKLRSWSATVTERL